ncbi:hypothetical protein [Salidesulfovibrio onnuriiensis]|uniref:hypothetical protein n=1 Tax=Salidesulfovibrio onnuriiensis TaxID=2583823 RepID=UPI0011CAE4F1|nr:hypothetical protein [Salidesulfovibrio onnuriiensis]
MTRQKQIIAGLCALVALVAISAAVRLLIIKDRTTPSPEHRATVSPPSKAAPDWVISGQEAKPDYSPADMDAKNATEVVKESPAETPNATEPTAPKVVEENDFITFGFLDSLTNFVVQRFEPSRGGSQPATRASFRSLNMYYSRNFDGIEVQADDLKANRTRIIDYVFTPTSVKAIYALYADLFVQQLADNTVRKIDGTEQELNREDMSDLFRLNAAALDQTALIFSAISEDKDLSKLIARYIQAVRAVERANVRFQESLSSDSISSEDKADAGNTLKHAIRERERSRSRIIDSIKKHCKTCPDDEVFYIALWSYRRSLGNQNKLPAFAAAADCLKDLSQRFRQKADELMQPE